jgi:excisionase family DNA binding protein
MSTTLRMRQKRVVAEGREPIAASEAERDTIVKVEAFLRRQRGQMARLIGPSNETIELPESAFRLLKAVIHQLAMDNAVSVVPVHKQLTTQQAADLLNISRPYLIQLLERQEIPYERVGTHRRLKFGDVMAYRQRRAEAEESAIDDLALDGLDLGL